jgi:hypothetical protein
MAAVSQGLTVGPGEVVQNLLLATISSSRQPLSELACWDVPQAGSQSSRQFMYGIDLKAEPGVHG